MFIKAILETGNFIQLSLAFVEAFANFLSPRYLNPPKCAPSELFCCFNNYNLLTFLIFFGGIYCKVSKVFLKNSPKILLNLLRIAKLLIVHANLSFAAEFLICHRYFMIKTNRFT